MWLHQKCLAPSRWKHLLCLTDHAKCGCVPQLTKSGMAQLLFKNVHCCALCCDKGCADSCSMPWCVKTVVTLMLHGQSVQCIAAACSMHVQRLSWKHSCLDIKMLLLAARPDEGRETRGQRRYFQAGAAPTKHCWPSKCTNLKCLKVKCQVSGCQSGFAKLKGSSLCLPVSTAPEL